MSVAGRNFSTLTLIAVLALTLAACGRKSGLDLPPTASVAEPAPAANAEAPNVLASPISRPVRPKPTVAPKRDLPIDILLN